MLGNIGLDDLKINCIVGILPRERETPQNLFLDVDLTCDFAEAAGSELVQHTVDYTAVAEALETHVTDSKFQLIETLAESCCQIILSQFTAVSSVTLTVKKPAAVPRAATTWVRVHRERT